MKMRSAISNRYFLVIVAVMGCSAARTRGDLLLGSFGTITWDRSVDATNSPLITIPIANYDITSTDTISGWSLRLATVQSSGTVDADFSLPSAALPVNHVLTAADPPSTGGSSADLLVASTTDVDGNGNFADGADADGDPDFDTVPASGRALLQFRLTTASAVGSSGIYQIFALNNSSGLQSGWNDQIFDDRTFGNLLAGDGSSQLLGTVNINGVSAIPEPSAMLLIGVCATGSLGVTTVRRRCRIRKPWG